MVLASCAFLASCHSAPWSKASNADETQLQMLYNPPAPERDAGAYSGTIGPYWYSSDMGWLDTIHESGQSNPLRALQLNQAGVYCFANKLDEQASQYFTQSRDIEKNCLQDVMPDGTWTRLQFKIDRKLKRYYMDFQKAKASGPITHADRLSGYEHNLDAALDRLHSDKDYQDAPATPIDSRDR